MSLLKNTRNVLSISRRNFSDEVSLSSSAPASATKPVDPNSPVRNMRSQLDIADYVRQQEAALQEADKDYLDMLNDQEARASYFGKLIHPEEGDHNEIVKVKNKIRSLLEQEAAELGFRDQLSKEELSELQEETYGEVATNTSFFFSFDANK